jgi:hypothetical protein
MWRYIQNFVSQLFSGAVPKPPATTVAGPAPEKTSRTVFRATSLFMSDVRKDLMRPHAFAHERVGFITVRAATGAESLVILAENYYPVADEDYLRDSTVGAMIGQEALRKALEIALLQRAGVFHVHMHGLSQRLWFSGTDLREQVKFVPDFFNVCSNMPHGAIVLNSKTAAGRVWRAAGNVSNIDEFDVTGAHTTIARANRDGSTDYYA